MKTMLRNRKTGQILPSDEVLNMVTETGEYKYFTLIQIAEEWETYNK